MLAAAILVYSLSKAAGWLGPAWSGVLAAFPVVGTVVLVATHWDYGFAVALAWLRGFVVGLFGYLAFLGCVAYAIDGAGIAISFGAGVLGAVLTQMALRRILQLQGRPSSS